MSLERIPPIIVAADNEGYDDVIELIDDLTAFKATEVGIKIPVHHINRPEMMKLAKEDGRFVILDTRLHDDADHMAMSARSLLRRPEDLLPDAMTVLPFFRSSSANADRIKQGVMKAAHDKGVKIIGYSGEIDQEIGIDDNAVRYEAVCFLNSSWMDFDGYEIHAANLLNPGFLEEINNSLASIDFKSTRTDITYPSLANETWPTIISSKFNLPISLVQKRRGSSSSMETVRTIPSTPDALAANDINVSPEQLRHRALIAAGNIFKLCVGSIYLGKSVTSASPEARKVYIRDILEIKQALGEVSVAESIRTIQDAFTYDISDQKAANVVAAS